jgi:hypothetical protein
LADTLRSTLRFDDDGEKKCIKEFNAKRSVSFQITCYSTPFFRLLADNEVWALVKSVIIANVLMLNAETMTCDLIRAAQTMTCELRGLGSFSTEKGNPSEGLAKTRLYRHFFHSVCENRH